MQFSVQTVKRMSLGQKSSPMQVCTQEHKSQAQNSNTQDTTQKHMTYTIRYKLLDTKENDRTCHTTHQRTHRVSEC
eukprot:m.273881 g.273881  ORF g.273881 m.273881 type:complete len:76 (+) comp109411_c0_seq1:62-289(+)